MATFDIYTVSELKQLARERRLAGYSNLHRDELIELLQGATDPTVLPEDILYELTKHLSISELKQLCSTNRQYAKLCQSPRFQQIINQEKAEREKERQLQATINELYQFIVNPEFIKRIDTNIIDVGFHYRINPKHTILIKYIPTQENKPQFKILEFYENTVNDQSILLQTFDKTQSTPLSNTRISLNGERDENDVRKLLNVLIRRPDFNRSEVGYYTMRR